MVDFRSGRASALSERGEDTLLAWVKEGLPLACIAIWLSDLVYKVIQNGLEAFFRFKKTTANPINITNTAHNKPTNTAQVISSMSHERRQ